MFLEIIRKQFPQDRTIGGFYIDGRWAYFVLEDMDRQRLDDGTIIPWSSSLKIPKQTAIPRGKYKVTISWSNRFKKLMPHILDVPDFVGIRIHTGNIPENTEGCPMIGMKFDVNTNNILQSKLAFDDFFPRLELGLLEGDVWLEIT